MMIEIYWFLALIAGAAIFLAAAIYGEMKGGNGWLDWVAIIGIFAMLTTAAGHIGLEILK